MKGKEEEEVEVVMVEVVVEVVGGGGPDSERKKLARRDRYHAELWRQVRVESQAHYLRR